jgi:hypothetical protein
LIVSITNASPLYPATKGKKKERKELDKRRSKKENNKSLPLSPLSCFEKMHLRQQNAIVVVNYLFHFFDLSILEIR